MAERDEWHNISISTGTIVRVVLILIFIYVLWLIRDLIMVLLTAIVIASFMQSSVPHLEKIGIKNRAFGLVVIYSISLSFIAGLFYLFAPLLITEIYNFSVFMSAYAPNISIFNFFKNDAFSGAKDIVNSLSGNFSIPSLLTVSRAFIINLSGGFFQILSVTFGSIFNFMLIILLSFYFSIQENGIESFLSVIAPVKYEEYILDLWRRSSRKIGLWVRGQLLLGFLVGILVYLILSLLGIQYALLLSIITGIFEMIPYGILVALVPTFAFAYLSDGATKAFMAAGAYIIIHEFDVFLFTPLIIKRIVGLSPIVIILSVLIGFELGSIWGAVLAIPLAVIVIEFITDIEKKRIPSSAK